MAATTDLHLGIGIDARDFSRFAKALAVAAPELRAALITQMRSAGEVVAEEARQNVAPYSETIPQSIRVRVSGATVSVIARGTLAGLFELGNRKSRDMATFSHPVFGNKAVWVKQPMHPFLAPAVKTKVDEVEVRAVAALDEAIATAVRL